MTRHKPGVSMSAEGPNQLLHRQPQRYALADTPLSTRVLDLEQLQMYTYVESHISPFPLTQNK